MSVSTRTPEFESLEIIVVGSFNPTIFHLYWFLGQEMIAEDDAKADQNQTQIQPLL